MKICILANIRNKQQVQLIALTHVFAGALLESEVLNKNLHRLLCQAFRADARIN